MRSYPEFIAIFDRFFKKTLPPSPVKDTQRRIYINLQQQLRHTVRDRPQQLAYRIKKVGFQFRTKAVKEPITHMKNGRVFRNLDSSVDQQKRGGFGQGISSNGKKSPKKKE